MIDLFLSLAGGINTMVDFCKNVSAVRSGGDKTTHCLERLTCSVERLSEHILYAQDLYLVKDTTQTQQHYIDNRREVRESLEPVQRAFRTDILSSAMIWTPEKMRKAMQANPWQVLVDVRPLAYVTVHSNPDMVPILFEQEGIRYVGWQTRGVLPMIFDCEYDQLWVPDQKLSVPPPSSVVILPKRPGENFQDRLLDGSLGPEMVWLPAGQFQMGDLRGTGSENEQPVHEIALDIFAMGKYPVTFAEYDGYADKVGVPKPDDCGWGRATRPVIKVSWDEAIAYAQWLSQQTGQPYRLPTEAEWEYAARAGTETDYWWGNEIEKNRAVYAEGGSPWDGKMTSPVGSLPSNPFGLSDMLGNVWEWTCSVYEEKYGGEEQKCVSNHEDNRPRVLRGGAWNSKARWLRTSYRNWNVRTLWFNYVGMRLSRR